MSVSSARDLLGPLVSVDDGAEEGLSSKLRADLTPEPLKLTVTIITTIRFRLSSGDVQCLHSSFRNLLICLNWSARWDRIASDCSN
jgi:hypothetical protein